MSNTRVARRYATALMELSVEQKKFGAVLEDLMFVKATIDGSHDLRRFLESPVVPKDKKKIVLGEIFKKNVGDVVRQYIGAIVEKGREHLLREILEQYFLLRDENLGIQHVQVQTATEFSEKQEKNLVQQLESFTEKKIKISFSIDRSLKGGFVAQVGDTMFDGSVRHQLNVMKARLKDGSLDLN